MRIDPKKLFIEWDESLGRYRLPRDVEESLLEEQAELLAAVFKKAYREALNDFAEGQWGRDDSVLAEALMGAWDGGVVVGRREGQQQMLAVAHCQKCQAEL